VLFALDLIIFTSSDCTYQNITINANGGAFYASQSSTYSQAASITSYQDTFTEIYAGLDTSTGFGGVIYVQNTNMDITFEEATSTNVLATTAGFAYITGASSLNITNSDFFNNTSQGETQSIVYKSEGVVTLTGNMFQGNDTFNKTEIGAYN